MKQVKDNEGNYIKKNCSLFDIVILEKENETKQNKKRLAQMNKYHEHLHYPFSLTSTVQVPFLYSSYPVG